MTGRDLIIYIMSNHLEDEPVYEDGRFLGFMTVGEAAAQMKVGYATVLALIDQGRLDAIRMPDPYFGYLIPRDFKPILGGTDEHTDNTKLSGNTTT